MVVGMADENTRLINGEHCRNGSPHRRHGSTPASSADAGRIATFLDRYVNFQVSRKPIRLFELCDQSFMPPFIRRCCQSMLAAQWTRRLPLVQRVAPAELAAEVVREAIERMGEEVEEGLTVVDFCSGGGGPVPTLESHINTSRRRARKPPIPFLLSDLHPHIDAWMELAARSDNLSFIPQPVDATAPPRAAMSSPSPQLEPRAVDGAPSDHTTSDLTTSGHTTHDPPPLPRTHILRTFHLSFHHFGDAAAKKVLASTLLTAHGIVITELQDRTLFSLVMMAADFLLVFPLSVVWFCCDPTFLVATWALFGLLPAVLSWDGGVSALRTRGGGEVLGLLGEGEGVGGEVGKVRSEGGEWVVVREGWEWRGGRRLHTWPIGYMNYVVGRRLGV